MTYEEENYERHMTVYAAAIRDGLVSRDEASLICSTCNEIRKEFFGLSTHVVRALCASAVVMAVGVAGAVLWASEIF